MAVHGTVDGVPNESLVLRMYQETKASDVGGGRNPEHGSQIAEPRLAITPKVPFPSHRLARLHRQLQSFVGDGNFSFRALELCDINRLGVAKGANACALESLV